MTASIRSVTHANSCTPGGSLTPFPHPPLWLLEAPSPITTTPPPLLLSSATSLPTSTSISATPSNASLTSCPIWMPLEFSLDDLHLPIGHGSSKKVCCHVHSYFILYPTFFPYVHLHVTYLAFSVSHATESKPKSHMKAIWFPLMGIMWPASQSHFHLLFIFIEMKFFSLSFLCDVCNEAHEPMQWSSELWRDHDITITGH